MAARGRKRPLVSDAPGAECIAVKLRFPFRDVLYAYLIATVFSGLPSTLHAFLTGGDPLEPTRAAGAMLASSTASTQRLIAAAVVVHPVVSLFWTGVFAVLLPRAHLVPGALLGSALVGLLDLRVIAPLAFPAVAALPFWPQFADHLMWGAVLGGTLQVRLRH
jgi:hypothetical protein